MCLFVCRYSILNVSHTLSTLQHVMVWKLKADSEVRLPTFESQMYHILVC